MKNLKRNSIMAISLAVLFLTGCIATKLPTTYEVTPKVLETHGGKVSVSVKGKFPEKTMNSKAVVEFTPVLKYGDKTQVLKPLKIKGEKSKETDGITINSKTGGDITYSDNFDYNPDMKSAELVVKAKITKGKKVTEVPEFKIADGVIYTSTRTEGDGTTAIAEHGYEKETIISKSASIYFGYNDAKMNSGLALNKTKKALIDSLSIFVAQGWKIKNININAWASPEGELSLNENLSQQRGATTNKFVTDMIGKLVKAKGTKLQIKDAAKEITFDVAAKGEDFDGFMSALNASNIADKKAIENVINSQITKTEREKRIKDMTVIYKEVEDMLSVLRRGEIIVNCYQPKKTDEQIAALSTSKPDSLDNKELLYAATLTQDVNTKLAIYKSAMTVYPNNYKGYVNAAAISLEQGNADEAISLLEKANTLEPENGQVLNNMGIAYVYKKDYEKAKSYFEQASAKGVDQKYNMGVLAIPAGDYAAATSGFESAKCKHNIALAMLLAGNNEGAASNLDCAPKTASVYYLTAVVGARTANDNMVFNNLKKAIQADAKYREEAKVDREFLKYFNNADFQNAIK